MGRGAGAARVRARRAAHRDPNGGAAALRTNPGRQARPHAVASAAQLRPARLSHLQHRRCLPRTRGAGLAAQGRRVRPCAAAGDEHQGQNTSLRTRRAGTIQGLVGWARPDDRFFAQGPGLYGNVTLQEYLERTTWHSGQHVRQLVMVLEMLGIEPDRPPTKETFAGLPMPDKVWDDERVIA